MSERPMFQYQSAGIEIPYITTDFELTVQAARAIAMLWRQQLPDGGWSTRRMSDLMKWNVRKKLSTRRMTISS